MKPQILFFVILLPLSLAFLGCGAPVSAESAVKIETVSLSQIEALALLVTITPNEEGDSYRRFSGFCDQAGELDRGAWCAMQGSEQDLAGCNSQSPLKVYLIGRVRSGVFNWAYVEFNNDLQSWMPYGLGTFDFFGSDPENPPCPP